MSLASMYRHVDCEQYVNTCQACWCCKVQCYICLAAVCCYTQRSSYALQEGMGITHFQRCLLPPSLTCLWTCNVSLCLDACWKSIAHSGSSLQQSMLHQLTNQVRLPDIVVQTVAHRLHMHDFIHHHESLVNQRGCLLHCLPLLATHKLQFSCCHADVLKSSPATSPRGSRHGVPSGKPPLHPLSPLPTPPHPSSPRVSKLPAATLSPTPSPGMCFQNFMAKGDKMLLESHQRISKAPPAVESLLSAASVFVYHLGAALSCNASGMHCTTIANNRLDHADQVHQSWLQMCSLPGSPKQATLAVEYSV